MQRFAHHHISVEVGGAGKLKLFYLFSNISNTAMTDVFMTQREIELAIVHWFALEYWHTWLFLFTNT
jgi:hypothetical protein